MSVRPVAAADTFCTIMSMFAPVRATVVKISRRLAGFVPDADDGDLRLTEVGRDPGDDRFLHGISILVLPRRRRVVDDACPPCC